MYVQFSDSAQTKIISVFSCPQDPAIYPNQAEVDATDERYVAFKTPPVPVVAAPTLAELQAQLATLTAQITALASESK